MAKFTRHHLLGSSNYEVWAATNNLMKREVALKQIPYKTDAEVPVITLEAQKQVALRHDNIIEVYGADDDTANKLVLIEMECADDGSLGKLLENGQRLPVERAVQIVCDVLTGLEYAHAQKIIHFDVKPDNILLFKKGTAKLADFGIAKTLSTQGITSKAGGTPGFEGPEYHDGKDIFGPRTDLWAVGVVLYIALTGRMPFLSSAQILKCKFEPLTTALSGERHAPALQKLLTRVFQPYPKRLATAKEFREALELFVQPIQKPVRGGPSPLGRRALIGTGLVGLIGGSAYMGKFLGNNSSSTGSSPPLPTATPKSTSRVGLSVAEARALPPTYPASKTLAEYKAQMVQIPGGTFEMGSTPTQVSELNKRNDTDSDFTGDSPVHRVTLSVFRMGRTPVTVAMWKEFCTATGRKMPSLTSWPVWKDGWGSVLDHPIVNVSWEDCQAYAEWAGLKLPTEAQWEYAARGGLEGKAYPWGDGMDDSKAWYRQISGDKGTAPVSRSNNVYVNGYGLVDMSGNIWQWCSDWYGEYGSDSATNPIGASSGMLKVLRGGSWIIDAMYLRCALRSKGSPTKVSSGWGFRLCG